MVLVIQNAMVQAQERSPSMDKMVQDAVEAMEEAVGKVVVMVMVALCILDCMMNLHSNSELAQHAKHEKHKKTQREALTLLKQSTVCQGQSPQRS